MYPLGSVTREAAHSDLEENMKPHHFFDLDVRSDAKVQPVSDAADGEPLDPYRWLEDVTGARSLRLGQGAQRRKNERADGFG